MLDALWSPTLAVNVTLFGVGTWIGAEYRPFASIVPALCALQTTGPPHVVFAVDFKVVHVSTAASVGVTVTDSEQASTEPGLELLLHADTKEASKAN